MTKDSGLTDFHVDRVLLDRIRSLNLSRVAIIAGESGDKDYNAKVKTVEFFVFCYCKTAVSTHARTETIVEDIMAKLTHSLRKKELIFSVGERFGDIDFISKEDFI